MDKHLLRTLTAIEECEEHLNGSGAFGSSIESYLTQHILILLSADIQQAIYSIVNERAAKPNDLALEMFVVSASKRILRSVMKEDIAKLSAMFGNECKTLLNSIIEDVDVTTYNNAIANRHDIAHKTGVNITFKELKKAVSAALKLIYAFKQSINSE